MLLAHGIPQPCKQLSHWLLGYCVALSMLPFCFAIAGPLMVSWAANGMLIRSGLPPSSQHVCPALYSFVDTILFVGLGTCGCLLVVTLLTWMVSRDVQRISRRWSGRGPAPEELIRSLLAGPATVVPPDMECTICLEDSTSGAPWRGLPCGHSFHQPCLLEWLRRSRRCPLCRLDIAADAAARAAASAPVAAASAGSPAEVSPDPRAPEGP